MDTKALRQKILDLAIRGKLVPQDPNDEPAVVLLERIRAEKQQMVKDGKLKPKDIKNDTVIFKGDDNLHYEKFSDGSVKCIEDEIPFEVPEGWAWCRLNSIVDVRDGTHDTPTYVDKGIPLITSKNLVEGGIDYSNVKYISEKDAISINERSGVNIGDILFAMIGTIGNPSMVTEDILISIKNVALFKFTFSKNLSNYFVMYFLDYAQEDMKNKPSGGLQPFVSLNFLRTYLVPIPPVEEQQRIVSILADSINKIRNIDVLKNELTASVKKAKSKILDLAIRGKLVPQDPNDEPASVLLEHIRAEKEELIRQGKIKRDKKESVIFKGDDNSYYRLTADNKSNIIDIPFDISDNWVWCNLSMIGSTNIGLTYKPTDIVTNGTMVLRSSNIINGKIDLTDLVRVNSTIRENQYIQENDILICARNGSKALVGKCAIYENANEKASFGAFMAVYRSRFFRYVYYFLNSEFFRNTFSNDDSKQINQLTQDMIKNTTIPLPPFTEKKRIVDAIETAFLQLDEIANDIS